MPVVTVNGLDIAYRRAGEGDAIVLAHGGASDGREWGPQLEGLADEFTVVAWDEPGSGASPDLPPEFGLADFADALAGLIEALELAPAHVGGLSWGGTLALELYRRHPDLVGTLILCDTYAGWKGSLPAAEVEARVAGVMASLEAPPDEFDATSALPGLFAAEPPPEVVAELERIMADARPDSLRQEVVAMAACDQRDLLPRIAVPTLLIWGAEDVRSPVATVARQFEEAIPGAELVVIPGAGHMANLERPAEFNAAVRAVLPRTPGAPLKECARGCRS